MILYTTCGTTTLIKESYLNFYLGLVGIRCQLIVTAEQILVDDHFCKVKILSLKKGIDFSIVILGEGKTRFGG